MLQIRAHTTRPRALAIAAITEALGAHDTIFEDMQEFSNRMNTYRFEIEPGQVGPFVATLVAEQFVVDDADTLAQSAASMKADEGFVMATLQATFPEEDGDRRNPNPDMG